VSVLDIENIVEKRVTGQTFSEVLLSIQEVLAKVVFEERL
jgi:hypothetical protein